MTDSSSPFVHPGWVPAVEAGKRILVVGASGGLGSSFVDMLLNGSDCIIGTHGATKAYHGDSDPRTIPLQATLNSEVDCLDLINSFCDQAKGIDGLVVLAGRLSKTDHWDTLSAEEWENDIHINLNIPFFLARAAIRKMKQQKTGGRILLNGTESAIHGGSAQSFPYAIAKRGTECMVEGLARDGAPNGILVNGIRFGFIKSGFHQRWSDKNEQDLKTRSELVPLKRGGEPEEAAALMTYLLSGWSSYITGQMFALTGGDWL
jgi:NAD(P)-dependent dehydrogenase (short-subunit alcohol dehydrogenase family)